MRLHVGALAVTGAIVAATAYVLGGIMHVLTPWGAPALVSYIFHVDIIQLGVPFSWDSFLVGAIVFAGAGAFFGGFAAWVYNTVSSEKRLSWPAKAPAPAAKP
ncbi:MAG TPA: hypothetical protein VFT29_17695 [Gemmatimonadaceae bacterium]|nr:hypothetical protein [Gemmatimonadaceae bacterium]